MRKDVFETFESNVRYYCRSFPVVFTSAKGSILKDQNGRTYLDLLSGAGTLNYGHNNPAIISAVQEYLARDGIIHSLDMHTQAKGEFIDTFQEIILRPRGLSYKLQFPGPTGTNAIEAALKLARKVTGRTNVVTFTNAFHGMSLGALSGTANPSKRRAAGIPLFGTTFMPYDGYLGSEVDTMDVVDAMLCRPGSGIDAPAAILIELVQGEGGLNTATHAWLKRLSGLAREIGSLLIVDDIQAGNGRTGTFFSFEPHDLDPDIVVLSKSLSGFGNPLSLVLIRPDLDFWEPGEHNGTFRGNNLAFVGAKVALESYWRTPDFGKDIAEKANVIGSKLAQIVSALPYGAARVKGRGLFTGIEFFDPDIAPSVAHNLFEKDIIIETCGSNNQVLKLLPALTIEPSELESCLNLIEQSIISIYSQQTLQATGYAISEPA